MWYRFLPRRLDLQIALICAVLMLCTIPFYIIYEARTELAFILKTAQREMKVLSQNIAVNSVEHIVTRDYSSLENLLIQSAKFPSVIDIQVADERGKVISDVVANDKNDKDPEPRYSISTIEVPTDNNMQLLATENKIVAYAPIESGTQIGWVKINYSLEGAHQHQAERLRDYFFDGSLLILTLSVLLMWSMRRPLKIIGTAVDFAARLDGNTGEQIPVSKYSVEIEKLFNVLNQTSLNLAEQNSKIKKGLNELETQKHALDEHCIVTIMDVNGNITYANEKLLSSTGYKIDELLGKPPSILNSEHNSHVLYSYLWDVISQGEVWHGEIEEKNKHKNKLWMQTTIVPFLDDSGKPYEYVMIQSDITVQKEIEGELAVKNLSLGILTRELENKVKIRTSELEKANEKLQHLNNVKSEFVSVVSHELRTPLTAIKSFSEILEDDFEELDNETRKNYLSIINEESVRLGRLINDVLDLQKIDAGKMTWHLEKTNIKKLAATTITLFNHSYIEKGLELLLDADEEDLIVQIDSDKIKQVISNLLSNAYKFTEKGRVTLGVKKVIPHPRALVVDDDEVILSYLEIILKGFGLDVICCDSAEQAIKITEDKSNSIELLITDIVMPTIDGVELIKKIRSHHKNLPIVAVSSQESKHILKPLLDYNVKAFIEKPFSEDAIRKELVTIFGDIKRRTETEPMIEVSVSDTGSGLPEDELSKVFERFHQVDNSETREAGGSGLGLAICKDIVEYHKGKLWVTSQIGKGSRFTFSLPLFNSNVGAQESVDVTMQKEERL